MAINKISGGSEFRIAVGIMVMFLVIVGEAEATKFINSGPTGGDCNSIGIWNLGTKTCTLTTNLMEGIQIDSDGVTLDGNGHRHTITGNNTGNGVYLSGRTGVTIKDLNIAQFGTGIRLYYSSNNKLSGNSVNVNGWGIYLFSSSKNNLTENYAYLNNYHGISLSSSSNNTLGGNTVDSNDFDGIYLGSSSNNTLISNNASDSGHSGIYLSYSSNNNLSGNNASNNDHAIGIWLYFSSNNKLSGNTANVNEEGIFLDSEYNILLGCNDMLSGNNTLSGNTVNLNNYAGIDFYCSSNNKIYNNIFNNTNNRMVSTGFEINTWNTTKQSGTNIIGGPYLGGNFWANPSGNGFSQTCADVNKDAICDSNYGGDYLPLKVPDTTPPRSYTFQTTNNAMQITVDGTSYPSPKTITWADGSSHSVSVPPTQAIISGQSQYAFTSWSGMSTSASPSISITAGVSTAGTYNANFNTKYYLTVNTDPAGLTSISGSGWYNSGTSANTGTAPSIVSTYTFSTWKVHGTQVSGNPVSVTMNTQHTVTAVYLPNTILTGTISGTVRRG